MPMEDKFGNKVTDPADPRRCQGMGAGGQCEYLAVEGTEHCPRHGGYHNAKKKDREAAKMYNLKLWRAKLDTLKQSPEAKSLGDEIAILRMTLEATLERCKHQEDLFMMSSTIGDLAVKIERILKSAHSLDQSSGNLMDKSKAIAFAGTVVEIVDRVIAANVKDVDLKELIVDQISQAILMELSRKEQKDGEEVDSGSN